MQIFPSVQKYACASELYCEHATNGDWPCSCQCTDAKLGNIEALLNPISALGEQPQIVITSNTAGMLLVMLQYTTTEFAVQSKNSTFKIHFSVPPPSLLRIKLLMKWKILRKPSYGKFLIFCKIDIGN